VWCAPSDQMYDRLITYQNETPTSTARKSPPRCERLHAQYAMHTQASQNDG
jgi:hypothetical protein